MLIAPPMMDDCCGEPRAASIVPPLHFGSVRPPSRVRSRDFVFSIPNVIQLTFVGRTLVCHPLIDLQRVREEDVENTILPN